jgi:hypothetical protein
MKDKIYMGQLRLWKPSAEWGGIGPFTVIGFREESTPLAPGEDPDVWVECLVEDGHTDEFLLDEVMLGSEDMLAENERD